MMKKGKCHYSKRRISGAGFPLGPSGCVRSSFLAGTIHFWTFSAGAL